MKGTRVQSIIRELRGEKIDIIQWSDDTVSFATNSISPGENQPRFDRGQQRQIMEMVVEDTQLSLAIGKKGQNVRLASKLIGWRIDIKSEEKSALKSESQMEQLQEVVPTPLENMPGLTPALVQKLNAGESRRWSNWQICRRRISRTSGESVKKPSRGSATRFRSTTRSRRRTRPRWSGLRSSNVQQGKTGRGGAGSRSR